MKKYNIYCQGKLISTEYEDELIVDLKESVAKEVNELKLGENHIFRSGSKDWEIERIV